MPPQSAPVNEVAKARRGSDFPANKQEILETAERNQASKQVMDLLQEIPAPSYESAADMMQQVGRPE